MTPNCILSCKSTLRDVTLGGTPLGTSGRTHVSGPFGKLLVLLVLPVRPSIPKLFTTSASPKKIPNLICKKKVCVWDAMANSPFWTIQIASHPFPWSCMRGLVVENGAGQDCLDLATAWAPFQAETEEQWKICVQDIKAKYDPNDKAVPKLCPLGFLPT
jgi:hypothetical protein